MRLTTVALVALLTACGGKSYCERVAADAEDCGVSSADADISECEAMMANCSKADEKVLNDFQDCIIDASGGDACSMYGDSSSSTSSSSSTGGMADFMAMMACVSKMSDLSEECAGDFMNLSGTSSSTYSYSDTGF